MKNLKQYYKELGKLVYAVAIADGIIQPEELEKLNTTVMKQLVMNEPSSDSSGMNQAFYVDFEFEKSIDEKVDIDVAVKTFNQFIKNNQEAGDDALIKRSLKLLKNVSNAYTDKKEKQIIARVEKELSEATNTVVH